MREVSHFLLELRNGSESRDVHEIPPSLPENEVVGGSSSEPAGPAPLSMDPLQSASPETRVSFAMPPPPPLQSSLLFSASCNWVNHPSPVSPWILVMA